MVLDSHDFKDYLADVTDTLLKKDIDFLKRSLNLDPDGVEKKRIIDFCEKLASSLIGDTKVLGAYHKQEDDRKKLKKKYGQNPIPKIAAIKYTGWSKSSFERKVRDIDGIKQMINEKPYFKIDDLEKIMRLERDSSKYVLCIISHFQYDPMRDGFIPFISGEYYKFLEENERFVKLWNDNCDATLLKPRYLFETYFRLEEDLKF